MNARIGGRFSYFESGILQCGKRCTEGFAFLDVAYGLLEDTFCSRYGGNRQRQALSLQFPHEHGKTPVQLPENGTGGNPHILEEEL